MSLVAMKVWMRGRTAPSSARPARSTSGVPVRARPATRRLAQLARHRAHGLEVALARDREARLDHVDAEPLELARERELLVQVHAAARRLLAVAQRGVEDAEQLSSLMASPLAGLASRGSPARSPRALRPSASARSTRRGPRPRRGARSRTASRSAPARSARSRRPRRPAPRRRGRGRSLKLRYGIALTISRPSIATPAATIDRRDLDRDVAARAGTRRTTGSTPRCRPPPGSACPRSAPCSATAPR